MRYSLVNTGDNLGPICAQMTPDNWAKDNEMTRYDEVLLREFLTDDHNILLLAWDSAKIAGSALGHVMLHPSKDGSSLYVHELDTHPDYRRQGVARSLMRELMSIAKKRGLYEVWVGTETTNESADSLYRSLKPYEIEPSYIYAYKVL